MQDKAKTVTKVRIIEVVETEAGYQPTGEEVIMGSDSPLFDTFGNRGKVAKQDGKMVMNHLLFQQVKKIVESYATS